MQYRDPTPLRLAGFAEHARRRVWRALAALLLVLPTWAAAQPLRLAVSQGPVSLPIYVASTQGFFEQEGLTVELRDCNSGRQCFQMLSKGEADLATSAELVVTLNSLAGSDAAIIATLSASTHSIKLVARRGSERLAGKRVGTVGGTSAQYFLDSWLTFHEIDAKDVTVVPLAPDQLAGALARRELDAIAIWEPLASAALAGLGTDGMLLRDARLYTQHFNLIASRAALAQREAELTSLLRALARATRFIAERKLQAAEILAKRLQQDINVVAIGEHEFRLALDQSLIVTMDAQARWALREGLVPAARKADNLLRSIEPGPLRKALPGAVGLVR